MKKLLALIGVLCTLTGYSVNTSDVINIFSGDYTEEEKSIVINYMIDELTQLNIDINEGNDLFSSQGRHCNNF